MDGFCKMNIFSTNKCNPCNCIDYKSNRNYLCPNSFYGNDCYFFLAWGCDINIISNQYSSHWILEIQNCHIDCELVWNSFHMYWSFFEIICGPHYLYIFFVVVLLDLDMLRTNVEVFLFIVPDFSNLFCLHGWKSKDFNVSSLCRTKVLRSSWCYYNGVGWFTFICSSILHIIGSILDWIILFICCI